MKCGGEGDEIGQRPSLDLLRPRAVVAASRKTSKGGMLEVRKTEMHNSPRFNFSKKRAPFSSSRGQTKLEAHHPHHVHLVVHNLHARLARHRPPRRVIQHRLRARGAKFELNSFDPTSSKGVRAVSTKLKRRIKMTGFQMFGMGEWKPRSQPLSHVELAPHQ